VQIVPSAVRESQAADGSVQKSFRRPGRIFLTNANKHFIFKRNAELSWWSVWVRSLDGGPTVSIGANLSPICSRLIPTREGEAVAGLGLSGAWGGGITVASTTLPRRPRQPRPRLAPTSASAGLFWLGLDLGSALGRAGKASERTKAVAGHPPEHSLRRSRRANRANEQRLGLDLGSGLLVPASKASERTKARQQPGRRYARPGEQCERTKGLLQFGFARLPASYRVIV
jgi:hypothetical protein